MPSITYSTPAPVNATTNKDPASSASKILNTSSEQARPNSSSAPSLDPSSSSDGDIPPENESISPQTAQNELENSDVSETAGEDQQSAISDSDTNEVAGTIDESAETPLQPFTETSQAASQALNVLLYPNSPTSAAKGSAFGENGTIKAASPVRETESGAEASEVLALSSVFDDLASPTKFGNGIRPASLPERNGTINDDDNDDNDSTGNPFNTFQNRPRTISNDTRGPPYFALHQGREYEIYDNSDTQLGSPQMLPLRFGEASPALNSFASVSVLERPVQPFNFDRRNPMFHHNGVHQALQSEYMDASGSTSAASVSNAAHQAHSGSSMNAPYSAPTYFPYQSVQGLTQGNTFQHTIHQPAVYQVPGATTSTHHFSGAPRRMMYPPPHFGAPALVMAAHTLTPIPPSGRVLDHGHPMPPARFVGTNFGSYAGASEGPGYPPNQWYGQENLGGNMEDRATNYETDEVSESPVSPEGFWGRRVPVPEIVYNCTFCHERITATVQTPFALCSGCGPSGYTYYCSVECLLLDAQTHSVHCLNYPASERAAYHNLPQQYLYVKDPLYQVDGPRESPEKFRQRTFAMYCSSGPFPNLLQAWTKVHGVPQNLEGRDISESTQKRTGDYYIFRSRQTADGLRPNPDSDVIFTIVLRNGDSLKGMLTRTLNACFLSYQPRLIEFLFRLIRYLLRDTNLFEILPHSCSQADTFAEFTHQFSLEFGFDASMQVHRTDYFNASIEWLEVFNYIAQLEVKYPVLDKWCRT